MNIIVKKTILILFLFTSLLLAQTTKQWKDDLKLIKDKYIHYHIDPFNKIDESRFLQKETVIENNLTKMNRSEIITSIMNLIASIGDGHTYYMIDSLKIFPVQIYSFENGYYLTNITSPYKDLIGTKLIEINNIPIKKIQANIKDLISYDSELQMKSRLPVYMIIYEVLKGKGLIDGPEITLTLENQAGRKQKINLTPLSLSSQEGKSNRLKSK